MSASRFFLIGLISLIGHANADEKVDFPGDVPDFHEEAQAAGLTHAYQGPWEYFVGGGAASFDCNGDRMPDLFLAGGSAPAQLFVNRSTPGGTLKFDAVTMPMAEIDLVKVLGAYPVNIDNDEYTDLVVLRLGENLILRGGADCSFKKANRDYSFDGGRAWSTAFSAVWEKGARFPTLAFGNYVDRAAPGSPWGTCHDNRLLRPAKSSLGVPNYSAEIPLVPGYCTLSMLFTDWDRSGEPALRITNDRQYYRGGREQLWDIAPGGTPREFTSAQGWKELTIWGMGIAETDLDGDGLPEYALSSMGDTKVQTLDESPGERQPAYSDIAYQNGMTAHRPYTGDDSKPSTGWHVQFADFNNDAKRDFFIAKGNVEAMPDFARIDPDNLLLRGTDGRFYEKGVEAGLARDTSGRGAVVEDFNADGLLDLVVVNRKANVSAFRNLGTRTAWGNRPMGNWVAIELRGGKTNPAAVGATIAVKTGNLSQTRTIQIGGGHVSGQAGFSHFGLGVAERATVRVKWPDGSWGNEYRVLGNNFVVLDRSETEPVYWYPAPGLEQIQDKWEPVIRPDARKNKELKQSRDSMKADPL